jgi:hypothetical protein
VAAELDTTARVLLVVQEVEVLLVGQAAQELQVKVMRAAQEVHRFLITAVVAVVALVRLVQPEHQQQAAMAARGQRQALQALASLMPVVVVAVHIKVVRQVPAGLVAVVQVEQMPLQVALQRLILAAVGVVVGIPPTISQAAMAAQA